jgi:hypothetical protein
MLGIQTQVAMLQRHVAGEKMIAFVPTDGFLAHGERKLNPHHEKQARNAGYGEGSLADGVFWEHLLGDATESLRVAPADFTREPPGNNN